MKEIRSSLYLSQKCSQLIININKYYISKLFQSLAQITTASVNKIILEEPLGVRLGHFITMYRI